MAERLGLLFSDGSILVLPDGTDWQAASAEAAEHDAGDLNPNTQVVRLRIELLEYVKRADYSAATC
jgi:hypothetical protein